MPAIPYIMAAAAASSAYEAHETRKDQERAIRDQKAAAANAEKQAADEAEKKRRENLMRQGMMSTVKTSPLGVAGQAQTAKKTLLGQ